MGLLAASACFQFGAAVAVPAFSAIGPLPTSAWRFVVAATMLLAFVRPRLRGRSVRDWLGTLALGLAIAVMTTASYVTLSLIPQGPATTLEFLGPFAVGVVTSRRPRHTAAALAALVGVAALGGATMQISPAGMLSGLVTATAFGAYVRLQARVGAVDLPRLSLAFVVAAACGLPLASPTAPTVTTAVLVRLVASAGIGVAAAYALDAYAIHRLGARRAGVLLSLDPAIGALSGFVVLGQGLTPLAIIGMALIMSAGFLGASAD